MFPVFNSFDREAFLNSFKPLGPIPFEGEDLQSATLRHRFALLEERRQRALRINELKSRAQIERYQGNFNGALTLWHEVARKNGGEDRYCMEKIAEALFHLRRYTEALQRYEFLSQAAPDNDRYQEALADCYYFRGEVAKAQTIYTKVQEIRKINFEISDSVKEKLELIARHQCTTPLSLSEISQKINLSSTTKLKEEEDNWIASIQKAFFQDTGLEWNKFIRSSLDRFFLRASNQIQRIRCSSLDGRFFSLPICPDFEGIVHFTSSMNARNILFEEANLRAQMSNTASSFLTNQSFISGLCMTSKAHLDFRNMLPEVGFLLDIPDPQRNIMAIICQKERDYFFENDHKLSSMEMEKGYEISDCFLRMSVIAPLILKACCLAQGRLARCELRHALSRLYFLYDDQGNSSRNFFSSLKERIYRVFSRCCSPLKHVQECLRNMIEIEQKEDLKKDETYAKFLNIYVDCKDCVKRNSNNSSIVMARFESDELYEKIEKKLEESREKVSEDKIFQEFALNSQSFFSLLGIVKKLKTYVKRLEEIGESEIMIHSNLFKFLGRSDKKIIDILCLIEKDILNICHAHLLSLPCFLNISNFSVASFLEFLPAQYAEIQEQDIFHKVIIRSLPSSFRIGASAVSFAGVVLEGSKLQQNRISNALADVIHLAQRANLPCFII
jgi:tetratricopeptide (TPR) repeat protein